MKPMAPRVTVTDEVHARLREAIIAGELEAGSLHSVYKLAETLGVSRTPVREAVLRLADLGMVALERNRGVRICGTTLRDIEDVFQLRLLLEVPATAYAAEHGGEKLVRRLSEELVEMRSAAAGDDEARFMAHDRAFHQEILAVFGNDRLTATIDSLRDAIGARGASTVHRSRSLLDIVDEHVPILRAVENGDGEAAAELMENHLMHTGLLLMQQIAGAGQPVSPDTLRRFRRYS